MKTAIVIPAFNEEDSIGKVIRAIPQHFSENIVVANNGSTDRTAEVASAAGAKVVDVPERGYGAACLAGIEVALQNRPDAVIFLDGDFSDYPEDMDPIIEKLEKENLDLVIGSRMLGRAETGSLLPQARFGNQLATKIMGWRYGYFFSDLGPFRAIRTEALNKIRMEDRNFGWTIEMQIKALRAGLRVGEVSVRYRKRIGKSKITGTVKGTIAASYKILLTLFRYSIKPLPKNSNP